ncbi:duf1713 domain protein [Trichoderma arundinaceum]|uniref:Small ribosomal subunit protein mS38 n=1 Tax=Trichoderma arundinaceum TaxID=490622 RepID=A0A395NJV3_TRIAR|nr:duf1713 domain protein [Trichoderma arundinaceum]
MLPLSVRRAVAAAPQGASGLTSLAASAPKIAASSLILPRPQRRFSSSKPSRSDEPNDIAAGQSVPASTSSRGESKGNRKRKTKESSDQKAAFKKLPSVPSTHHMSQEALSLSSFFSLHRPISITQTMPRTVTDEHFASIFAPRTKANRIRDTVSTISDTIDQLEGPMAQVTIGAQDQGASEGMQRVDVKNPDGTESSVYLQVDTMSGEFLPFRPPPLPEAQQGTEAEGVAAEAEALEEAAHHRVYKAMFTIEESTEPDGQIRIIAHSPRIIQDGQPRSFLERLALRQLRLDQTRGHRDLYAISVKRQRKLKMKKKKYKKLMKRTRNLRRKLDRT